MYCSYLSTDSISRLNSLKLERTETKIKRKNRRNSISSKFCSLRNNKKKQYIIKKIRKRIDMVATEDEFTCVGTYETITMVCQSRRTGLFLSATTVKSAAGNVIFGSFPSQSRGGGGDSAINLVS